METPQEVALRVAGRGFTTQELQQVTQVVTEGVGLSRTALQAHVCQRLHWCRPTGALKVRECRDLLERLERDGWLRLPPKRPGRPPGSRTRVPHTAAGEPGAPLVGSIEAFGDLTLEPVTQPAGHRWWRELVGRYHYLSYRVPFGAHLRYLAFVSQPRRAVVAAVQVSSPAWRLAVRDRWIGWDDGTRGRNLQRVVNHSRFVILPWVRVRNLASRLLSVLTRQLPGDWQARYGVTGHAVAGGDDGRRRSFPRDLLPRGQLDVLGRDDGSGPHGSVSSAPWERPQARVGLPVGRRCSAALAGGLSRAHCARRAAARAWHGTGPDAGASGFRGGLDLCGQ